MAGKKSAGNGSSAEAQTARAGKSGDEGFVSESANMQAPWWVMEAGARLKGKLLGAFDMPDQFNKGSRRHYVQVELLEPTRVKPPGEDAEVVSADKGEVVSVGVTARLEPILTKHVPIVDAGGEVHLLLSIEKGKQKTKSGNSVWPVELKSKVVKAPTRPVVQRVMGNISRGGGSPQQGEDEVPY